MTPRTDDDVWIPIVADQGWIAVTKDSAIGRSVRLRQLVVDHDARLIAIGARDNRMRIWDQPTVLTSVWPKIEALSPVPGPWMYRATRSGLTRVALPSPA